MADQTFSDIPVRANSTTSVTASWWNLLRSAGLRLESRTPVPIKYTVDYTDIQTAGLTNDVEIFSLAAMEIVTGIEVKHSTAFAGSGITDLTATIGITGTLDKYFPTPFDVIQAVAATTRAWSSVNLGPESHGATTSIRAAFTAVGANLDQLSQGSLDIWVMKATLPA